MPVKSPEIAAETRSALAWDPSALGKRGISDVSDNQRRVCDIRTMPGRIRPMDERKLAAMATLRREIEAAEHVRVAVLVRTTVMQMAHTLTAAEVAEALGISRSTWHEWTIGLDLRALAADCVAEVDKVMRAVDAGADNTVSDLKNAMDNEDGLKIEHALASIGVWRKP